MSEPFTPRAYQGLSTEHMLNVPRCALWAGMGLGKTIATLNAVDALQLAGESDPVLVLAPLRVARSTWVTEAAKWDHLKDMRIVPIVGSAAERALAARQDAQVFTTNYENLEWLTEQWGSSWPYRTVIADEATKLKSVRLSFQTSSKGKEFLRGQGGKRARALGMVAHSHVRRFIELTGTPAPNGLKDLWGQIWFLDGGRRLGRTYEAFKQRWFETDYDGRTLIPRERAEAQIHAALADICLTIDAKDYFDLKEPIVNEVFVDLPVKARKLYKEMENDMFAQIAADRSASAVNAAGRTQKCLQLSSGAVYLDPDVDSDADPRSKEWREVHDAKLEALDDIIEEACGAPVIVVYEFRSDLERLLKAYPKGRALRSQKDEDDFKAGRIPVLFTHPKSAGHGIDGFQYVCNQMVFFTRNWSLEDYLQIVERIGPVRQMQAGMDRPVFLHHIVARNTVDELVSERLLGKKATQEILLDAMKRRN